MSLAETTLFDIKKKWWNAVIERQNLDEKCIDLQIKIRENKRDDHRKLKIELENTYQHSIKNDEEIFKLSEEMLQCEKDINFNNDIEIIDVCKQNILDVPINQLTIELCESYVRKDGQNLRYVPDHMKTNNICKMAVRVDGTNIKYIPRILRTKDICWMAIEQNVSAFYYVPKNLRTIEMCQHVIQRDPDMINVVPKNMRNEINHRRYSSTF